MPRWEMEGRERKVRGVKRTGCDPLQVARLTLEYVATGHLSVWIDVSSHSRGTGRWVVVGVPKEPWFGAGDASATPVAGIQPGTHGVGPAAVHAHRTTSNS